MRSTEFQELEQWLSELEVLLQKNTCEAPNFLKPYHLATIAHSVRGQAVQGRKCTRIELPEKLTSYANVMRLWEVLNIAPPQNVFRSPAGRYHPLTLLNNSNQIDEIAKSLVELIRPVCADEVSLNSVDTLLRELIGNCFAHTSVSDEVYGMVCAQVWSGGRKAQIAIADNGIGIRNSLGVNALLNDRLVNENACEMATEYGVTGKPGKGHSGYGLAIARKLLEQNVGTLIVRSGTEIFMQSNGQNIIARGLQLYVGTLIVIEWDLDNQMNISEVYKSFPLPEGMTDDDFDF